MSNKYQQIEKCCPVLMFSTVYFYDFCERQNYCPKSKNYHFGNTGTERLSLNGNRQVKGAFFWFICLRPKCFREKEREAEERFIQNLHALDALDEYKKFTRAMTLKSAGVQDKL